MKNFSILVLVFLSFTSFAQQNKVIIISNKYEFQKEKNTYNINTMLKAILISNSYQVFFDDEELPVEIAQNKCNALTGVLIDNSNLLVRKIKFQIRDCQNNLLFETAEVKTREKDIQNAYIEIIKMLSPELKKYDTTIIQEKEVVATPEIDERLKISEFKTFLNCKMEEIFDGFHVTEVRDSNNFVLLSMQKTKNPNVFIASRDNEIGIFTKTGNKGVFEYYIGDKYMVEEYLF
jgi:phage pi2 protein 07